MIASHSQQACIQKADQNLNKKLATNDTDLQVALHFSPYSNRALTKVKENWPYGRYRRHSQELCEELVITTADDHHHVHVGPVRSAFFDISCPVSGFKPQDKKAILFVWPPAQLGVRTWAGEVGHYFAYQTLTCHKTIVHEQTLLRVIWMRRCCHMSFS